MDFFEKIYQITLQRLSANKKNPEGSLDILSQQKSIEFFGSSILSPKFQPQVVGSIGAIGISGNSLFLPSQVTFSANSELNRKILLNLTLLSVAAHNLKLYSDSNDLSPINSRIIFLESIQKVNIYLDDKFEGYRNLQEEIRGLFTDCYSKSKKMNDLYNFWNSVYCARAQVSLFKKEFKKNEPVPLFLFLTTPSIMATRSLQLDFHQSANLKSELNESAEVKTEIEKPHEDSVESVELKNQELNPVTHSFEKMETAEEYQGGRRIDSGDDELKSHSDALHEVNLKKVTRDGQAARSIYRSGSSLLEFGSTSDLPPDTGRKVFLYQEWSIKKSAYLPRHCKVFESSNCMRKNTSYFRKNLANVYRQQLGQYKFQIQNILNEPLWVNRLKDADEIDYDSFARDFTTIKSKKDVEGKWYSAKLKKTQGISVLILFDQSLSSDSWIKHHRVLDVILHSIGIAGILFENVIKNVHVAGAWSSTRSNCSYKIYKNFEDPWANFFDCVEQIEPQGYTRLGPAIRHATEVLSGANGRHRMLLILTDGKPTDLDGYEGRYGAEDVKRACQEAERRSILPYAMTIDSQAKHYFPRMFSHYKVLSKPDQFSEALYRILLSLIGKGGV